MGIGLRRSGLSTPSRFWQDRFVAPPAFSLFHQSQPSRKSYLSHQKHRRPRRDTRQPPRTIKCPVQNRQILAHLRQGIRGFFTKTHLFCLARDWYTTSAPDDFRRDGPYTLERIPHRECSSPVFASSSQVYTYKQSSVVPHAFGGTCKRPPCSISCSYEMG